MTKEERHEEKVPALALREARAAARLLADRLAYYWDDEMMELFYNQYPWLKEKE